MLYVVGFCPSGAEITGPIPSLTLSSGTSPIKLTFHSGNQNSILATSIKFQLCKVIKSRNLLYNIAPIVNNRC